MQLHINDNSHTFNNNKSIHRKLRSNLYIAINADFKINKHPPSRFHITIFSSLISTASSAMQFMIFQNFSHVCVFLCNYFLFMKNNRNSFFLTFSQHILSLSNFILIRKSQWRKLVSRTINYRKSRRAGDSSLRYFLRERDLLDLLKLGQSSRKCADILYIHRERYKI